MNENLNNISPRTFVIEMSVKIEHLLNLIIAKLLFVIPENSKSFGASSQALSFNSKANLLFDLDKLNKEQCEKFQIFMQIRNKFAHMYSVDTFEKCFEQTKNYNRLKKIYGIDENGNSLEEDMETMFSVLSMDIAKLISEIKEELYCEMAVKYTQRRFSETVKEKREHYKSLYIENAEAVEHFINFIKAELLKEVDKKIENKIQPNI
jgi:hypothetical protein